MMAHIHVPMYIWYQLFFPFSTTVFVAFVLSPDNVIGLFKDKNDSALWIAPSKNDGSFPYSAFFGQAQ